MREVSGIDESIETKTAIRHHAQGGPNFRPQDPRVFRDSLKHWPQTSYFRLRRQVLDARCDIRCCQVAPDNDASNLVYGRRDAKHPVSIKVRRLGLYQHCPFHAGSGQRFQEIGWLEGAVDCLEIGSRPLVTILSEAPEVVVSVDDQ